MFLMFFFNFKIYVFTTTVAVYRSTLVGLLRCCNSPFRSPATVTCMATRARQQCGQKMGGALRTLASKVIAENGCEGDKRTLIRSFQ